MKFINFFKRHYWLFLALIVLVSYGQLLLMYPWQDDHALLFKLANIKGPAGYLGTGIFGTGPYKYTAFFYYPIYLLFDYKIPLYFLLTLVMYFLPTLSIYKVFSKIVNENAGRLAGFLFGAGFIAADGFIRLFNSVGTSLSVILISFLLLCYWYFLKKSQAKWYFFVLVLYFLSVELIRYRTHYLIVIPIAFEFLFLAFSKPIVKSVASSFARLVPFGYLFYRYFVVAADERSTKVGELIVSVVSGQFDRLYSFFASLTNLVTPDWLTRPALAVIPARILSALSLGAFSSPALNLSPQGRLIPVLGILVFAVLLFLYAKLKTNRKLYLFLLFWLLVNIAGYAAYEPTHAHETTNRFLAHSFFALAGLLAVVAQEKRKLYLLVILWGVGNLFNSFVLQRNIVVTRSRPAKVFYEELKKFVPKLEKGDVLYFDVADDRRQNFTDAFSVAQMPEETAIAWQYGIDRYDIRRVTDCESLTKLIAADGFTDINKEPLKLNKIHTFFYSGEGLIETTPRLLPLLQGRPRTTLTVGKTERIGDDIVINLAEPIVSLTPAEINLTIAGGLPDISKIKFPLVTDWSFAANSVARDERSRELAFDYKRAMEKFRSNAKVSASSVWQKEVPTNLIDGRSDTSWRADRVIWPKEGASFTLDLGQATTIDRFVWVNANATNSPTKYEIEVSADNRNWTKVAQVARRERIEAADLQVVSFEPAPARFVKMVLRETLSRDSASIAEIWVVPVAYRDLDIKETEVFLANPLGYLSDAQSFISTLSQMGYLGKVQVSWFGDKSDSWQTREDKIIDLNYDGATRTYHLELPAGGTKITKLKLTQTQIPGEISVIR